MINPKLLKSLWCCLFIMISAKLLLAQEIERKINLSDFNQISLSSGIKIYLTQGEEETIRLKGNVNALDKVMINKKSNVLELKFDYKNSYSSWGWKKDQAVKAYISFKTLNKLIASGGSDIIGQNNFKLNDLSIISSGGSNINLNLTANYLKVTTSGGSDIKLNGRADELELTSSGGSDIKAFGLIVEDINVVASGSSDVQLHADKSIKAVASGASEIQYKGSASKRNISSSGAASINMVN